MCWTVTFFCFCWVLNGFTDCLHGLEVMFGYKAGTPGALLRMRCIFGKD